MTLNSNQRAIFDLKGEFDPVELFLWSNFHENLLILESLPIGDTMKKTFKIFALSIMGFLFLNLTACSTVNSAYDSTVNTVSGWFKTSDEKK